MELDQAIFDEFISESKELLEPIENDLMIFEKQIDNPDEKLLNKIFRAIHTIKGASSFFGMTNINKLTHTMETLLSSFRKQEIKPESRYIDVLLEASDLLHTMLDNAQESNNIDISGIITKLNMLLNKDTTANSSAQGEQVIEFYNHVGHAVSFILDQTNLEIMNHSKKISYSLKFNLLQLKVTPYSIIRTLLETGDILSSNITTDAVDLHEHLSKASIVFNILYYTYLDYQNLIKIPVLNDAEIAELLREKQSPQTPPEKNLGDDPGPAIQNGNGSDPSAPTALDNKQATESPGTIRIKVELLDKLMTFATELVLIRNQQLQAIDKSGSVSKTSVQRLDLITSELQEAIMRTRMQPVGNIFNKFSRIVRELAKNLDKKIEISITGSEVELDKTIIESLTDPLTHLIRNCCDHGIETPDERRNKGKQEVGMITLRAYHEAGQINLEIKDDGRGINLEKVKKVAVARGFKTANDLVDMSDKEIVALILKPGFTTADTVSDLSGRGVGLDVVKSNIEKLSGTIEIDTQAGKGTTFNLRLPLTLAIIPSLIVVTDGYKYAIPQSNVEEMACLYDDDILEKIEIAGNQEVYRLRDKLLPLVRLNEVLKNPDVFSDQVCSEISQHYLEERKRNDIIMKLIQNGDEKDDMEYIDSCSFVVIKVGHDRFGLIVDKIIGTEEIVVKPMHPLLKSLDCYLGATVMGDGNVALILDIEGIARHTGIISGVIKDQDLNNNEDDKYYKNDLQTILLFKYGQAEQFAINLPLIQRIEKIKTSAIERISHKEYINIDDKSILIIRPDQMLKVGGCEDTEEMFLILPKYMRTPTGILCSKIIDTIDTNMELDTNSYMEDGILGTKYLHNHITLFLDIYRLAEKAEPEWFSERNKKARQLNNNKKILLLEDTSFFRELVKGYFVADGYEVWVAENGEEGLEYINNNDFNLIVSDLEMPVMDGWEFIEKVRENDRNKDIPSIALTALDTNEVRERAFNSGFDRFEVKLEKEKLLDSVTELLESKKNKGN